MRCDAWVGVLSWWRCQSPVAHSCSFQNHPNNFHGGTFKLNRKFDADTLLYNLSHFEWDGHTVHMLTQQCLPPPLTSTVKLSLFIHAHSSPLPLAARLHWCCTNHSCYINNGWTFSRPWYIHTHHTNKHTHTQWILVTNKISWNLSICYHMDGPEGYYSKWNKLERQRLYDLIYMWNLKKMNKQNITETPIDKENRLMVAKKGREMKNKKYEKLCCSFWLNSWLPI